MRAWAWTGTVEGCAYPLRARIEGEGVGAIRHCEFTTGAFVEPITAWEPGVRLSFDVASQPAPMHEWSPYQHVHPPHLDGYLRIHERVLAHIQGLSERGAVSVPAALDDLAN